ncbi:hypothetical protein ACJIZ3_014274 [Penstemon smallii]|uniref:GRF-type domain-containing protein n=1 Tax=Penstemon smallii TaxID=265156 RepID=A0ABD3RMD5_9LAMI
MYTSNTKQNPGRHFLRCGGFSGNRCDFFDWVDPYGCERASTIIPGLLVRLNHVEERNRELETRNARLDEENIRLRESLLTLQASNNSLLYKFKLVKICAVCLVAFMLFMF